MSKSLLRLAATPLRLSQSQLIMDTCCSSRGCDKERWLQHVSRQCCWFPTNEKAHALVLLTVGSLCSPRCRKSACLPLTFARWTRVLLSGWRRSTVSSSHPLTVQHPSWNYSIAESSLAESFAPRWLLCLHCLSTGPSNPAYSSRPAFASVLSQLQQFLPFLGGGVR